MVWYLIAVWIPVVYSCFCAETGQATPHQRDVILQAVWKDRTWVIAGSFLEWRGRECYVSWKRGGEITEKWAPSRSLVYWSCIQMVGLVHKTYNINWPFEYQTFDIQMFPVFKWSVFRSSLYTIWQKDTECDFFGECLWSPTPRSIGWEPMLPDRILPHWHQDQHRGLSRWRG